MKFEDNLRYCLLTHPTIHPTALHVYDHLFLVVGNGYEWEDGELVEVCGNDFCKTVEESVVRNIRFTFEGSDVIKRIIKNVDNILDKTVERMIKESIIPAFHVDERMQDFTIPEWYNENLPHNDFNKFKFYGLSNYSKIFTIPDDVKNDWLIAAKKMIGILEQNQDKFEDTDNLFPEVKKRIESIYNDRYNTIVYYDGEYDIVGKDTEEVGAGCHSWFQDVYVCRNRKNGRTRNFDKFDINKHRLINQ